MLNNRNLLEELMGYVPEDSKVDVVQTRATHVISSTINLMDFIAESFSEDEAKDLTKRLMSAIKNKDHKRFERGVEHLHETRTRRTK